MIGQWKTVIEVTTLHQVQKLHDFALDKTESLVKWKKKKPQIWSQNTNHLLVAVYVWTTHLKSLCLSIK